MNFRNALANSLCRTIAVPLAIFLVTILPTISQAETFSHITGENGSVQYDLKQNAADGSYTEPGSSYRSKLTFKQGQRNSAEPVLVGTIQTTANEHFCGEAAIQIQINARDEVDTTKAAYKASIDSVGGHDPFTPQVAKPIDWYHGFALKIDPACYKLPENGELMFEQWWQGTPFHPPVALVIVSPAVCAAKGWSDVGGEGNFALVFRDDDHDPLNSLPGFAQYFDLGPVTTGKWMRWIVHVRPSPIEAAGAVDVTLDGQPKLNLTNIRVGYNPAHPQYTAQKPSNRLASVNVCLYRMNGQNFQRFFFDEIKFASTAADAAP